MSDLTPKGFSNGQYVDRFRLRDKLYAEGAITMKGVAILNEFPAADVVEVVRCRECIYLEKGSKFDMTGDGNEDARFCGNIGGCTNDDWFCADGERKDGGRDNGTA